MTKIIWDEVSKRLYKSGVDQAVLYLQNKAGGYEKGEGWNGLTGVTESPEGADRTAKYANNNKYLNLVSQERFKGSIKAFTYPNGWNSAQGIVSPETTEGGNKKKMPGIRITGQKHQSFGLTYRTLIGNDTEGTSYGYEIHLVYNATAGVSSQDNVTINESPDATEMSWDFDTLPVTIPGFQPTSHIIVSSIDTPADKMKALEDKLYGTATEEPSLPNPEEVFTLLGRTAG